MDYILPLLVGYLSGSIPFGLLLANVFGLGDIRTIGSGNIGATNVLRTGNKTVAALTLLADALKGALPVLYFLVHGTETAGIIAGFAALAGHMFPLWLKFKGGKGVATLIGVTFGLAWPLGLMFLVIWLGVAVTFKMSSLSALAASLALPFLAMAIGRHDISLPLAVMAACVWFMHRANIARLWNGTESKISLSKTAQ